MRAPIFAIVALLALTRDLSATALDTTNFAESVFLSDGTNLTNITGIAWAPDGSNRLFVTRRHGQVRIIKNGALLPTPFATLSPLYANSECGVIGICFDPNFYVNHYVYLFVTVSASEQQIIRYTDAADAGTAKTPIVTGLPTLGDNHNGGGIGVGYDGKLYWSIGDNGSKIGVDNDLTSLAAKVGRANRDGSAPVDNPFYAGAGAKRDWIWARGFRNPFTLTFQPITGLLWLNVVGSTATGQTNPNSGPGFEQVFIVRHGDHGGYDDWEANQPAGYIFPAIDYQTAWTSSPAQRMLAGASRSGGVVTFTTTAAHPFRKHESVVITGAGNFSGTFFIQSVPDTVSFTATQTGLTESGGGGGTVTQFVGGVVGGGAVSGGHFYESTAFPPAYHGNFFFGDYVGGKIMRATIDGANRVTNVSNFVTGNNEQIDIATGPDGALYYTGVSNGGQILRLASTSTQQNLIVTPTAINMLEGGQAVLTVRLAQAPAANTNVYVAKAGGDADITLAGGATLTFTPENYDTPQLVTIAAANDSDVLGDNAVFTVSSPGLASYTVNVNAADKDAPNLLVSQTTLSLNEGATGTFTVRLANAPAASVNVTVSRSSGDADISVTGGATLTFTPTNFATPQTVTVSAAQDADALNDTAIMAISAPGELPREVAVTAIDNDPAAPAFTSSPKLNAVVNAPYNDTATAGGNPKPTFALTTAPSGMSINAATGVIAWTPTATGSQNVTIRASNGTAPDATQSFTISVNADTPPTASLTAPADGATISGRNAEFFGNGFDDVSCVKAEFFVDGVLRYTDIDNENHFHYGGAHLLFDTTAFADGTHTLKLQVTDTAGQTGFQQISVTIANGSDKKVVGNWAERTVVRNLPTVVGNEVDIGTLTFTGGTGIIEAGVNASGSGWSVSKRYVIPIRSNLGNGSPPATWLNVLPTHDTGPYAINDFALDLNVSGATALLRLRTVGSNGNAAKARITMKTIGLKSFVNSSATAGTGVPAQTVGGNAADELKGKAGVGAAPSGSALIDVNGGNTRGLLLRARSTPGAPSTGTWSKGTIILDSAADLFICTATGTPGTWKKVGAP